MKDILIIGGGVGGLTTAAVLSKAGLNVTVLEAHVYAGGSAGTFFHQKYRFDAGATLAGGFYPGGPMDLVAQGAGVESWPVRETDPAMVVHLPDGQCITRWTGDRRWDERRAVFGAAAEPFWRWQENTADMLWDFALRTPPFPPQALREAAQLTKTIWNWGRVAVPPRAWPGLARDAFSPISKHLPKGNEELRLFIDAQLLISAQTTSPYANSLFGASALDLPRRGVVHVQGGMGGIANTLVEAIRSHGGEVLFRQEATQIRRVAGGFTVETKRKRTFEAKQIVVNLPPWNIAHLMGEDAPRKVRRLPPQPKEGWGAFMVYLGVEDIFPHGYPLHHQIIAREPMAEGNTIFVSLSPRWDAGRAPDGHRALTISTHTNLKDWWDLFENDRAAYEARKFAYTEKILALADKYIPGLRGAVRIVKPGTPVTFQRFTRRQWGWVGGFPQTHLLRTWAPKLAEGLWMVGDSIFPGQSTAAVALGGLRVARSILN